jgi:hypothetical protein
MIVEATMTRRAACSCGQLHLTIEGEPSRIAMCHCLECQRRTGAVISNQARFRLEQVSFAGKTMAWTRMAESGNVMTYHFCMTCGSTVFWENEGFPGHVTIAIGNFADPSFPAPTGRHRLASMSSSPSFCSQWPNALTQPHQFIAMEPSHPPASWRAVDCALG